jgi:predicted O-methyltransferase YrrM
MNPIIVYKYLRYKLFSRHKYGHGIHSPFVFNLITSVFRNKTGGDFVYRIESLRRRMLKDDTIVNVTDLGSGSKHMEGNRRKISDIAKYSSIPSKYGVLLASMSSEFGAGNIIELGTSLGISTLYLASGNRDSRVISIEGSEELSAIARSNFMAADLSNIEILSGSFDENLRVIKEREIRPGLVFIDGDHRKDSVIRNFSYIAGFSGSDTVIIVDDIHSSEEMDESWEWIKSHEGVTITIDLFRMGLVFFRTGVTRSDYVIRY